MHDKKRFEMTTKRDLLLILITALALVTAACGSSEAADGDGPSIATVIDGDTGGNVNLVTSNGRPPVEGGGLAYGLAAETDGWNPTLSRWSPSGLVVGRAMFDFLVVTDQSGDWQPEALAGLASNADFTEWTFTTRPGMTFHNGKPFDAEALKRHLEYIRASPLTGVTLRRVLGSLEVTSPTTLVAGLTFPWASLPFAFASQIGAVADADWLASGSATDPVGAGAFQFVSWDPGVQLEVRAFDDYWRDGAPLLDEVTFVPVLDDGARRAQLVAGDLDVIGINDGANIREFREQAQAGERQLVCGENSDGAEQFVMLNLAKPPFDDPDVRLAAAKALERGSLAEQIGDGEFAVASSPYDERSPWHVDTTYPDFDPAAAAEMVAAIETETGPITIELKSSNTQTALDLNEAVAEDWRAAGFDVDITTREGVLNIRDTLFGDFEAVTWQLFDGAHPVNEAAFWTPEASAPILEPALNFARNEDPELVAKIESAMGEGDPAESRRKWGEVQRQINVGLPYLWIAHGKNCLAAAPDVVDLVTWETSAGTPGAEFIAGSQPLWQVWLDR